LKPIFILKIFVLLLLVSISIIAQTGGLTGRIVDNYGSPIPGVNIFVIETRVGGVSDSEGIYRVREIPTGIQTVRYSAVGYETEFFEMEIFTNRFLEFDVTLNQKVIEVGEVEIIGEGIQPQDDTQTSLIDLEPESARVLPGAATDVFRTLQALPGVLAPNDFSSQLIVRGSGPDQNLIVMDDVEVFNPYRLYGVISMFNPESVTDINLIAGGFPVKYGDRLSAVLDVTNRQGTINKNFAGTINASIVDANVLLEGKNPFNLPGSWLLSTRRTYYDLIIEPFVKNTGLVEDNVSFPNFYDVQAKLAFGPFNGHKFLLNGIISKDAVNVISPENRSTADSVAVVNDTKNNLASLAWHYAPTKRFLNKLIISWYKNYGIGSFDSQFLDPSLNRDDFENVAPDTLQPYLLGFGFDSDFEFSKISIEDKFAKFWGNNNLFEAGAGVDFITTKVIFEIFLDPELKAILASNPNISAVFEDLIDVQKYNRYKGYIQNKFFLSDKLVLQPGLRYDYYDIIRKGYLAPRISLSYAINDLTTLRAAWGLYYQSIGYEKLQDSRKLLDLSDEATSPLKAENALHYVFGIERWITNEWRVKFEGYYKDFNNLIVQKKVPGSGYYSEPVPGKDIRYVDGWTAPVPIPADSTTAVPINDSFGEAYGFEFLLEKKNIAGFDELNGWLSYVFAFTNRVEYGQNLPFRFDQRHTLDLVLNYRISSWLDLGVRFQYGSGFPLTEAVGIKPRIILADQNGDGVPETPVVATRQTGDNNEVIYDVDFGDTSNKYSSRKPNYHRLDLRLTAFADFWDFEWAFYLDVINVYNRTNVINYDYYITSDLTLARETTGMFPILPTLGFNVRF